VSAVGAREGLALARFEAALCFVDDVKAASATHYLVVAMAFFQRFQ